ncbi:alpha/beta fold hydrolase [Elizabethkingia ursingii]|uniref:Alpha/beta hydrolase n=1 Tax=Elizabethkingia ursingii TaxID=1756150 RepID=A0AAJ3NBR6_9FLAO|nr:alpha/beta hydrolase [Elizabethkingia ursingii]AQX09095.1 alpha/beta hydrolase [Elizabethkingia ursingii]OPB74537.1 alpha/beta hydrolase [Elizabethkingia ursingii]
MLHYEISGDSNQTLVLLHGVMESTEVWYDMLPELEKHFRIIRIDLPGHGKSELSAEVQTMELMAAEVKTTLKDLVNGKIHLLGHSMGGYVSLAYAEMYPDDLQSITLFFSTYFPDTEEKKNTRRKSFRIIMEEYNKYVAAGVPNLFNPYEKEQLRDKIDYAKQVALATPREGALASVKGMIERTDKRHILEKSEAKILILSGRFDNAVNSVQVMENLPDRSNIKAYTLDCGHNGHWEKPAICTEIIKTELL